MIHNHRSRVRIPLQMVPCFCERREQRLYMEGIYTTSVKEATIDEAPMAYKSLKDIIDVIRESVDEIEILKPIYNFKASE